jgi:hypothetical protein
MIAKTYKAEKSSKHILQGQKNGIAQLHHMCITLTLQFLFAPHLSSNILEIHVNHQNDDTTTQLNVKQIQKLQLTTMLHG